MIMIPAFMQRNMLEQGMEGGVDSPPESLYSAGPSSLAASTLLLSGFTSSHMHMTIQKKPARMKQKTIQKKAACMKGRPTTSRGMPVSDREELNAFLQKHSLHAAAIQIDLPTKVPRWGSAELFEGDCMLFSAHPPTF